MERVRSEIRIFNIQQSNLTELRFDSFCYVFLGHSHQNFKGIHSFTNSESFWLRFIHSEATINVFLCTFIIVAILFQKRVGGDFLLALTFHHRQ